MRTMLVAGTQQVKQPNGFITGFFSAGMIISASNESVGFYDVALDLELEPGKIYFLKWYIGALQELDILAHSSKI